MSNYKRKKPRKQVRCDMCTDGRNGNSMSQGTGRGSVAKKKKIQKLKEKDSE